MQGGNFKTSHKVTPLGPFKLLSKQAEEHFYTKSTAKLQMVEHVNANLQRFQETRKHAPKSFVDRGQKALGTVREIMV